MIGLCRTNLVFLAILAVEPLLVAAATQTPAFEVATIRPSRESVKFEHDERTEFLGDIPSSKPHETMSSA